MEFFCVKLSAIYLLKNCVYYMLKVKVQIGRFYEFNLQYIFVQVVKAQVGQKKSLMIESQEIIVIYV